MPAHPRKVALFCPAKVNLALSVGAPTATPRGLLHPLASWMVAVTFGDDLEVAEAAGIASRFDLAFAKDAPRHGQVDWPLEKDLCWRAHAAMEAHTGRHLPVQLTLRKRIPAGAGLGGGSSDAAATLVAIDRLFELHLEESVLLELGAGLGSDVPFLVGALRGRPSAIVSGLGEQMEPVAPQSAIPMVLILPSFPCPTGAVYQAYDRLNPPATLAGRPDLPRVRALAGERQVLPGAPFNDLAEPACEVRPELGALRAQISTALGLPVHVSGSGSTLFLVLASADAAEASVHRVAALTGLPTLATRVISR